MIYLDNSATTQPSEAVLAAMTRAMTEGWHNPSSLYRPAMEAEKRMAEARDICLKAAGATGHRLIFTSGGTEADNLGILGYLRTVKRPGRVLMLATEHPAVLSCRQEIERLGHKTELIPVRNDGVLDLAALERMLGEDVVLLCVMQVNNEVGAVQPIDGVVRLRDRLCPKAAVHVDGVQGFLRVPFHFGKSGVQSYALSGHKIHACKGVGALIMRKEHRIAPILLGGGQEDDLRSGTENTPGIIGLGEAVKTYPADAAERMTVLKRRLWEGIHAAVPAAILNGPSLDGDASAPHILSVSLPPVRSQTMLFALEGDGVYVSNGSACASRKQKVSGVLSAMGLTTQQADCTIRMSLCPSLTEADMDATSAAIGKHYEMLKAFVRR